MRGHCRQQQRISVRFGLCYEVGCNNAACAWPVVNQDGLLQRVPKVRKYSRLFIIASGELIVSEWVIGELVVGIQSVGLDRGVFLFDVLR